MLIADQWRTCLINDQRLKCSLLARSEIHLTDILRVCIVQFTPCEQNHAYRYSFYSCGSCIVPFLALLFNGGYYFSATYQAYSLKTRDRLRSSSSPPQSCVSFIKYITMQVPSPPTRSRARLATLQHRVLIYLTCYNVLDGYVNSSLK